MAVTTGVLAQDALNISNAIQQNILNGQYVDPYVAIRDLCTALNALANAYYATLNSAATPSLTTSVAVTPVIGTQYQTTTGTFGSTWPAPVQTGIR
jgi:hypothetical protein